MAGWGDHGKGRTFVICFCGVALRFALGIAGLQPKLESAMELVVSSTSWERAQEGLFLGSMGLPHYAGGVFTGSPLMLMAAALCAMLPVAMRGYAAAGLFAGFDLASALLIREICKRVVAVESGDWEVQLEEWMEEDAKPPRRPLCHNPLSPSDKPPSTPRAPSVGADTSTTRTLAWAATNLPDVVVAVYLLNPVLAAQCAALSGDIIGRVLPLVALAAAGAGRPGTATAALAAATCLWRFYAAALLVPVVLILGRGSCREADIGGAEGSGRDGDGVNRAIGASSDDAATENYAAASAFGGTTVEGRGSNGKRRRRRVEGEKGSRRRPLDATRGGGSVGGDPTSEDNGRCDIVAGSIDSCFDPRYFDFDIGAFLRLFGMFLAWLAFFLGSCWLMTSGSWGFLSAAAREQLLCESLTPNPGLYWYFFAEIFPRFRGYFRVLFLSQPYVYVLPATLRLGMFPEALATLLFAIFALFHPYPSLAEPFVAGCLFMCFPRTSVRMRLVIPVFMVALVPSVLLPIMRHVWLQAGTGNANFYYFQTVVLNLMWSMLVLQFGAALVKRRKALTTAFVRRRKAALSGAGKEGNDGEGPRGDGMIGQDDAHE